MSRSSWKNPFVHQSVRRKVKRIKEMQNESGSKKFRIKIMSQKFSNFKRFRGPIFHGS